MNKSELPEISVEDLMEKIRAEVNRRKTRQGQIMTSKNNLVDPALSALKIPVEWTRFATMTFSVKDRYQMDDFMIYHGRDFIRNAYLGILNRQPDVTAFDYYLNNLETGKMSKAEILGRLRYSSEGRAKRVYVRGLLMSFLIHSSFRIPVLGYLSRLGSGILNLPTIIKNFQTSDANVHKNLDDLHKQLGQFARSAQTNLSKIMTDLSEIMAHLTALEVVKSKIENEALVELDQLVSQKARRSELEEISLQKADRSELEELRSMLHETSTEKADRSELEELRSMLHEISSQKANQLELQQIASYKADISLFEQLRDSKADRNEVQDVSRSLSEGLRHVNDFRRSLLDQERRLRIVLEEVRRNLSGESSTEEMTTVLREQDHLLDAHYVSFEDQFRGTRSEIMQRLKVYLPYIDKSGLGSGDASLLDVGCGRGEWLQLCQEHGLVATGIDVNRVMVDEALQMGLDVVNSDFVTFLRKRPANTCGVITSFHLIEHLSLEKLIALFDEALRVLMPGGLLILETPNPDNILVGCRSFYMDPTHLNPLPSPMLRYLAEARGFVGIEILNLNPVPEYERDEKVEGKLAELIYGPRDYALLGYKP